MTTCEHCGTEPLEGDNYCRQCGEELVDNTLTCECGAEVLPDDNFCHACGAGFSGEVEESSEEGDDEEGDQPGHPEDDTEEESEQNDGTF